MKTFMATLLLVGAGLATPAFAQTAAPSPLLGSWEADVPRLPIAPDKRPKRVVITYTDVGGGKWRTNLAIVAPDGAKIDAVGIYDLNGTAAASTGYPGIDTVAITQPAPNVLVGAFYKDGMPRTTRTYVVSADGQSMSETAIYININGKPEILTYHFKRVR